MGRPRPAVGGSHSHSLDSVPSPGLGQRKYLCAGVPKGAYSGGLLGAKTEIPAYHYYETNQYGADFLRQAGNYGYQQGFQAGAADRQDHWRSNYPGSYACLLYTSP